MNMNTMGNLEKRVAEFAKAECSIFLAIWDVVSKQNRDMSENAKLGITDSLYREWSHRRGMADVEIKAVDQMKDIFSKFKDNR